MFVQLSTLPLSQHHYVHLYLSTKHRPYLNLYYSIKTFTTSTINRL
nr:MAG TPA: hypothetical protein [Bacteriophage sp.]